MEQSIRRNKNIGISFYIQIKTYKSYSCHHRAHATVCLANSQLDYLIFLPVIGHLIWFALFLYFSSLSVYVDYVNYSIVIFILHLHLHKLSLICDMRANKITYLYFNAVIHLSARCKTYINLYFLKYCHIVGNLCLHTSTSCAMTHRWRFVTRDRDQKAHKAIHINISFTRSRKSKDVEIVAAEI